MPNVLFIAIDDLNDYTSPLLTGDPAVLTSQRRAHHGNAQVIGTNVVMLIPT